MAIERDDKDWTWVLQRPCPECGFAAADVPPEDIGARLRSELPTWRGALAFPWAGVRPDDATWSPVEYACHIRDVATLYSFRLTLMLTLEEPEYQNWSADDAAEAGAYAEAAAQDVLPEVQRELEILAGGFDAVTDEQWSRTGRRSDGARFTIATFAQYLLHDVVHHGWDVSRPRNLDGRFEVSE